MIRSRRIGLAHSILGLFAVALLVQAARVQIVQGRQWRARAERQQTSDRVVPAERGEILDATHRVLAQSNSVVRLEIAPREVTDPRKLRLALSKLRVAPALIKRALDTSGKYLVLPGRFPAADAVMATSLRGVHSFASVERSYQVSEGAQGIIGHVDIDNKPVDGLEMSLDSILRGVPGTATIVRDSRGRGRESPIAPGTPPVRGNSIVLTINADLQEIAEKSLSDAVARLGAEGGDIVILDPHTGEIRAMASRRPDPRQTAATVITEPFEPGSTFKPFIAAGLIDRGKVSDRDSVDTGNGVLEVKGRKNPIRDDHLVGRAPLSVVLRWSSNIGIVKFASRLTPREEFETLRDFGFGIPTGLPYPTESGGTLRSPVSWSSQSGISMAMGYEVAVTPLQLATAYAAFANGGELVQPSLVKEIVSPDGTVLYSHKPRVVRRVVSKPTADKVRHMLLDVVDEGTALEAALDNYTLAGKTGTPRSTVRGHYVAGRYNPNFVGIFPADNPQYVVVVKMTAPQSSIYAAQTAAPVTKAILEAAVAAQNAALDRGKLASSVVPSRRDSAAPTAVAQAGEVTPNTVAPTQNADSAGDGGSVPFVVALPAPPDRPAPRLLRTVPDVHGLVLRDAVRSLHSAGFRVQLTRSPANLSATTAPAAGELARTGTVVRLLYDY
ncbi:MAG TPA: penicillin-binding transpeptidase domain-containing protein [Gemmatimonadaceae bacterium]|nr:penicillin-binding transpeptidase domain-containing protein [Gemmatimonadaceae bacterium]